MEMTLSNAYLSANLDILEQFGFPKSTALEALKLDEADLSHPYERVCLDKFLTCLEAAADYTDNHLIGLHLGLKFRVGGFGSTGAVYSYCENLEEVMVMNNLYQKLAIDAGKVEYLQDPRGGHHMCFSPHYSDLNRYKHITDIIMASYVTTYRWLSWGSGEDVVSAKLPYLHLNERTEYETLLQTDVELNSKHICVEFSDVAMSQKLTTRNPERLARTRLKLDKLLGQHTSTDDFDKGVEAAIRGAIKSGQVSAQVVADRMGLSPSVFRTRLAETGEGIRPKIDRVRKSIFIEKNEKGLSFSQIALCLAYNDQAAMNRAFRRWFGMTPTEWLAENAPSKEEA